MKYKIGDAVKIRDDLECGFQGYGEVYVTLDMSKLRGKVFHIKSIDRGCITRYILKEDPDSWYWTDDMFEVKHKPIVIYQKDADTVVALDKETQKEGKARCSKDDKFDFIVGAKLALERLSDKLKENEPTTLDKRCWLDSFCNGKSCPNCILEKPVCRCGCGTHFLTKNGEKYEMTDEEINLAYALAKTTEK